MKKPDNWDSLIDSFSDCNCPYAYIVGYYLSRFDKDSYQMVHGIMHRNISMPFDVEQEFWFFIERYIRKIDNPEAILFEMTKNNAFKIVWRYFKKKYNHWFRHQRASDLSVTYSLNNLQMQHFFGWSSSKMADRYTHLSDTDLLRTMVRKNA
jgi:hypothetical protein